MDRLGDRTERQQPIGSRQLRRDRQRRRRHGSKGWNSWRCLIDLRTRHVGKGSIVAGTGVVTDMPLGLMLAAWGMTKVVRKLSKKQCIGTMRRSSLLGVVGRLITILPAGPDSERQRRGMPFYGLTKIKSKSPFRMIRSPDYPTGTVPAGHRLGCWACLRRLAKVPDNLDRPTFAA